MTLYRYDEVSSYGQKSGICTGCGKRVTRKHKFTNTVNPFNKNEDGTIRTHAEVRQRVDALRAAWESRPVAHARCEATS